MEVSFSGPAEYEAFLRDQFQLAGFDDVVCAAAAAAFAQARAREYQPSRPRRSAQFGLLVGTYVIRTSDLKLFQVFLGAAVAVTSANAGALGGLAAGLLASIATMADNLRKKGAIVDPLQAALLAMMRTKGRMSLAELTDALNAHPAFAGSKATKWSASEVTAELEKLGRVALNDGVVVPLVAVDGQQRWGTVDL